MADIFSNTRKRSRSSEEEDFLPLSKKINNLHINQWNHLGRAENDVASWESKYVPPNQPHAWPPPYAPELSPVENPFYYETNKLLFDLYLARTQRSQY